MSVKAIAVPAHGSMRQTVLLDYFYQPDEADIQTEYLLELSKYFHQQGEQRAAALKAKTSVSTARQGQTQQHALIVVPPMSCQEPSCPICESSAAPCDSALGASAAVARFHRAQQLVFEAQQTLRQVKDRDPSSDPPLDSIG